MSKENHLRNLFIGGILMIAFTLIGDIIFFESLYLIGLDHLGEPVPSLYLTFLFIYLYIALYGGFFIIIGYYSFKSDFNTMGKLLTSVGIILGTIAFIIFIITAIIDLTLIGAFFVLLLIIFVLSICIGLAGIILSILSFKNWLKILQTPKKQE